MLYVCMYTGFLLQKYVLYNVIQRCLSVGCNARLCAGEVIMCSLSVNSQAVKYEIFLLLKPWQREPGGLSDFDELTLSWKCKIFRC